MLKGKSILVVEDETRMQELIGLYLGLEDINLFQAYNGREAYEILANEVVDLILLDVMLPGGESGFQILEKVREKYDIPVIMLTARSSNEDVIKGLQLGSDDYITKPFDEAVLLARIEAVLRRSEVTEGASPGFTDGLEIIEDAYRILYEGNDLPLTRKEFELIVHFINHPGRVFNRDQLMESLWGYDSETEDRTIDSHIRNIRDKFRKISYPIDDHLKTIWGVGYRWEREV